MTEIADPGNYAMQHWNNKMMCAIDTETTGLDPSFHEIIQIAILPLDSNFEQLKGILPFYLCLKPEYPERVNPEAMKVNKLSLAEIMTRGIDKMKAADMLENWFKKLGIKNNKYGGENKIMPLGQNYGFDRGFIQQWLGVEQYNTYFDYHYRDLMHAALYLNDKAGMHAEKVPFPKVNLQYIATTLKIETDRAHDALQDCLTTSRCYKQLCKSGLLT